MFGQAWQLKNQEVERNLRKERKAAYKILPKFLANSCIIHVGQPPSSSVKVKVTTEISPVIHYKGENLQFDINPDLLL